MDVHDWNRTAWDRQVENRNRWTLPVGAGVIEAARRGQWQLLLTDSRPVPRDWFPRSLEGADVLCLASGGGQQGPILAAAGATVTVFDLSEKQLAQDRLVAEREGLALRTEQGNMADLSRFASASFDLVFNPVSTCFVPALHPVWQEVYRVLRPGGTFLSGHVYPFLYLFDRELIDREGIYQVRYKLPYSDVTDLPEEERRRLYGDAPLEFSHTMADQIGGQLEVGFVLTGFYEDVKTDEPIGAYMPAYYATRARKP